MKEYREISELERNVLIKGRLRGPLPIGTLFYIMGLLLPFFTCMVITGDFTYLYLLIVGIIILIIWALIYPKWYYNRFKKSSFMCFESSVVSCKKGFLYYHLAKIYDLSGKVIKCSLPLYKHMKAGSEVIVVMTFGQKFPCKYLLIDKKTGKLLSCRKTYFDLV